MTLPGAVLWDMDGTLVDTEPYWIECEHQLVRAHGNGRWTEAHAHALVGKDLRDSARYIRHHGEVDMAVDDVVNILLDGVIERVNADVPWRPGARELLAALNERDVPCALVTMSWRRFAAAVIDALPPDSFQMLVAGDEITNGKPHPEPYLSAAAQFGLHPSQCVAIEDSPTGMRSAFAAGCQVVVVPHIVPITVDDHHLGVRLLDTLVGVGPYDLVTRVAP
jgi:HAD superfamily hydrolase (TIGR01509 family)